ncbi:hypothetical protein, partial [Mycobacterium sp. ZZG]
TGKARTTRRHGTTPPYPEPHNRIRDAIASQRTTAITLDEKSGLAFARHKANGHAIFAKGQLALLLGRPTEDGFKPADKSNVQRAIRAAISNKWLDPESCSECLVVPSHAVQGGLGSENEKCSVHDRKAHLRQSRKAKLDTSKDRS